MVHFIKRKDDKSFQQSLKRKQRTKKLHMLQREGFGGKKIRT